MLNTGIRNVTFRQGGTGNAVEITEDVTLTGVSFEGYGPDSSASAAILVSSSATGDVTITTDTTPLPTVLNSSSFNVTVQGPNRNFELTGLKDGTEVRLINSSTPDISSADLTNSVVPYRIFDVFIPNHLHSFFSSFVTFIAFLALPNRFIIK